VVSTYECEDCGKLVINTGALDVEELCRCVGLSSGVPWIQTHLGIQFIVLEPRFENIHIEDIAHALSMNCRFNGHCKDFYSVAEHSVYVSSILDDDPDLALWGLLHDASEAYITDLPRTVKSAMPQFEEIEEKYHRAVATRFNLPYPIPGAVLGADLAMLWAEKKQIMEVELMWTQTPVVEPACVEVQFWNPRTAKAVFLERFKLLQR
jgi:hypothetical protein